MPAHARTARETLRLPDQSDGHLTAPWAVFDAHWYRTRYPDAPAGSDEELLEWHLTQGQLLGHSPNRYFDEDWQRQAWPGILALIEAGTVASAFDAWCRGPNATRPPHWLFDPREYRTRYPGLTDEALDEAGFVNLYHHYLSNGAAEGRIGHSLFHPAVWLAALDPAEAEAAAAMPYLHYLRGLEGGVPERQTSPLFDPDWYRDRYPEAARSVASGQYRSVLEHYLRNDRPTEFDPSPWFSEEYYLAENPGVARAVGSEGFRNGFVHFLVHGVREGRSPHPDLDLAWYAGREDVRADIEAGLARDAFLHWITIGHAAGLPGCEPPMTAVTRADTVALYQRRADIIMPLFGRHKLNFSRHGDPAVSVIMAVRNRFADAMISLAALRAQYRGEIELILIDSNPALPATDLETHLTGATILRFGAVLTDTAAREAGLICATADVVLLLGEGTDLAPGAVDNALARLTSDPGIGAVGGRLIQPHGALLEAGGIIWRDGRLQAYARDASPLAPEANFVRDTDFCSTVFLLARRDVLAGLPEQSAEIAGTTHDAADLCTRIRQAGFQVVYEPDALAFLTSDSPEPLPDGQAAFVAAHADTIAARPAFEPEAIIHARTPRQGQTRVLFIEDSIPLRRIGSGFVRSNDVLRALAASGASVTVFPMNENGFPLSTIRAELPDTVEVMHDRTSAAFAEFVATRLGFYDLIWIARTHNLDLIHEILIAPETAASAPPDLAADDEAASPTRPTGSASLSSQIGDLDPALLQRLTEFAATINLVTLPETTVSNARRPDPASVLARAFTRPGAPRPRIVIDSVAVTSVRQAGHAALLKQSFDLDSALRQEFQHLDHAMSVVAVTEAEATIIRAHHQGPVTVLGHGIAASPTSRAFEERTGMLFIGAIHGMDHPGYEGLAWFIDEVLPLIEHTLQWETRLTVAGYVAPGVTLDRFKGHKRVSLRGAVAEPEPEYDAHRVFIAPTRFAAGLPYHVHEAAAFGLPIVATSLLARQLGWPDGDCIGAADATDPAGFAARVVALYRDAGLWTRVREAALNRVRAELDPSGFASRVGRLSRSRESVLGRMVPDA